jgi:hypothetical protein
MNASPRWWRPPIAAALLCAVGLAHLAAGPVRADGLEQFTGYTRPGSTAASRSAVKPAGVVAEGAIGGTIYFMVLDRTEGTKGDAWGTGVSNFDGNFVPARDSNGKALYTGARYLYLYQVINDSGRTGRIQTATIRLLVPPDLITSWGHFVERTKGKKAEKTVGVGFSMAFPNTDPKTRDKAPAIVLPVSTERPGVSNVAFRDPAPHFLAPKPYGFTTFPVGKAVPIADGEDRGREPEAVLLLTTANFEGTPVRNRPTYLPIASPTAPLGVNPLLPGAFGEVLGSTVPTFGAGLPPPYGISSIFFSQMTPGLYSPTAAESERDLTRSPAIRAYWTEDPLAPKQRSTLFGFTSIFPPVYDDGRLRGNPPPVAVLAVGGVQPAANLVADGEVPTPIAAVAATTAPSPTPGSGLGTLGGGIPAFGGGRGFGGFPGGFGGGFGGFPGGFGGFPGGGFGSGNGTPTQNGAQNQQQTPTSGPTGVVVNNNNDNTNTNEQNQQQQQQQQQQQKQHQRQHRGHNHHVVPAPAAWLLGLLGMPVFLLLKRRKSTPEAPTL